MNKKSIFVLDFIKEEIIAEIKFEKLEGCPSAWTNSWVYVQPCDNLVLFSEKSNDLDIADLKTGMSEIFDFHWI